MAEHHRCSGIQEHLLTKDSMTTKLARLINWVTEILDRNLIMVPELDEP
ncbi:hypothetical protein [Mycobacterium sp.]|jgi:hypothetical protein